MARKYMRTYSQPFAKLDDLILKIGAEIESTVNRDHLPSTPLQKLLSKERFPTI
jgi:hypothetical protein